MSEDIKLQETPEKLKGYEKMAVDGILRFDTKIDTDGFRSGTKEISSKMLDLKIQFSTNDRKFSLLRGSF